MAYIKQTWVDDETPITADKMNHIEDGIGEVEASLTQQISLIQGGTPTPVSSASAMTDTSVIYLYTGTEEGYESGHWYYYSGTEWTDGGQYGADGGINTNARNILKYILERVAYTEQGMQTYVDALYQALAQGGGGGGTTTYMIMNALTHVTNSNTATGCDEGDSYTATLTPDTDYSIDSVVITMGGVDVTSTVYSNGEINIASVTGDVVITATAVLPDTRFAVEYQGNFTTSAPLSTRVTLITNDITLAYGETLTLSVENGYKLFALPEFGTGGDSSLNRTVKETNAIYVNAENSSSGYVYGTDVTICGWSGQSPKIQISGVSAWSWATSPITYTITSSAIAGIVFGGLGFYIEKTDGTDITIEEAKSAVSWVIS